MTQHALLADYTRHLEKLAAEQGLDYYPIDFEVVPANFMTEVAVYGLHIRMPHWSFGVRYIHQLIRQSMGHSRIFEVMFPGNPCHAYLVSDNSIAENTLVVAHVIGHADFAKRNSLFERFMAMAGGRILEQAAERARAIERALIEYGQDKVEQVLDAALALEPHIDIHQALYRSAQNESSPSEAHREYDLLWFIARHAPDLQGWQRDIFLAVREESFFFYPVFACQIMNKGWASYWHARLLRQADFLPPSHYLAAIKAHSDVVRPFAADHQLALSINPYHLGFSMWEDIIERHGIDTARQICHEEDDFGFIRNHLTQALADQLNLFVYQADHDGSIRLADKNIHAIREAILSAKFNYGAPRVAVKAVHGDGSLELAHDVSEDGRGLDLVRAERVLNYIAQVWQRPVSLHTVGVSGQPRVLSASLN